MFKKSLMALALVGAAAAAQAGNVQVYGVVDAGVQYQSSQYKINGLSTSVVTIVPIEINKAYKKNNSSLKLASGSHSGNRFGIKGTEEIAPNLKAGFVLEGGFDLLNGDMADKGKLFNRQADLFVEGEFGHLAFGRMGTLTSANGSYGIFGNAADNFAGGWGEHIGAAKNAFVSSGRIDNAVTYVSPEVGGAKLYAQYSFNQKGEQKDKLRENDRYAAIGATYKLDNLELVGIFDKTFYNNNELTYPDALDSSKLDHKSSEISDRWSINVGASYQFNDIKFNAAYQHAEHAKDFGTASVKNFSPMLKETGLTKELNSIAMVVNDADRLDMMINHSNGFKTNTYVIGADKPLLNGVVKAQLYYGNAKLHKMYKGSNSTAQWKGKTIGFNLGYEHDLSKRTQMYVGAGYNYDKYKVSTSTNLKKGFLAVFNQTGVTIKHSTFEAVAGLVHKF